MVVRGRGGGVVVVLAGRGLVVATVLPIAGRGSSPLDRTRALCSCGVAWRRRCCGQRIGA